MRKGIGVAPGVAVGTAYCVHEVYVRPDRPLLGEAEIAPELRRFDRAREQTLADLEGFYQKVSGQLGEAQAAVFRAEETVLTDAAFTDKIRAAIVDERLSAAAALERVLREYDALSARTRDPFLRQRLVDVRDAIIRLSGHLSPMLEPGQRRGGESLILVADEILPWQVVALGDLDLAGIVTERGGETSHAALLARRRGVPAVTGVSGILKQVTNGDPLVLDGRTGHVIVRPDAETHSAYLKLAREFVDLRDHLAENRLLPAVTADGEPLELLANINSREDADAAVAMGAAGVGLYRTEYLFLTHREMPTEAEQLADYRDVAARSPHQRVTIRTLDLGGDKTVPYLGHDRQANPFLGWRSIRLSFEHPDVFLTQIRAVLQAAAPTEGAAHDVQLMFPMITTLEELRRVRQLVERARQQLRRQRRPAGKVPIGLMVEVPAAAVSIETLLDEVDFVSIGSNDLIQYLMAADRDNPKVSHLCQPLSPAVLRVLKRVIDVCRRRRKPVTLCGEMAGRPRAFVLLLGMGLRSFSLSPAQIPAIKDLARHVRASDCEAWLADVLAMRTTAEMTRYLGERLARWAPDLKLLGA